MRYAAVLFTVAVSALMLHTASIAAYTPGNAPYINTWLVLGTFDNDANGTGFGTDLIGDKTVQPVEGMTSGGNIWRYFDDRLFSRNYDDYQDLFSYYRVKLRKPTDAKIAYAHVYIHSETDQQGEVRIGADSDISVWINGQLLLSSGGSEGNSPKDAVGRVLSLRKGWNSLLLKVANRKDGLLGFYCRVCDPNGNALPGLTYSVNGGAGAFGVSTKAMSDAETGVMPAGFREWPYIGARIGSLVDNMDIWPEMKTDWENAVQASSMLLTAQGGTPPYKWSLEDGKLPKGLKLNRDGTITGEISYVNELGTYKFTAQVTDAAGHKASKQLSIDVKERPNKWYEEGRLTALIHGPEQISGKQVMEMAKMMKRQGYAIGMPISYGNGDYVFRWPSVFEPSNALGDVIGEYKKALEAEGVKFGMYFGNAENCPQFDYSQLNLVFEDMIKKYHPAAFWLDWSGLPRKSTDAIYSMVKSYDPDTLIVLNGIERASNGDWDVLCIEDFSYGDYTNIWGRWPGEFGRIDFFQSYQWFKTHRFETWKLMMQPKKPGESTIPMFKNEGIPNWQEFLKLQISLICEDNIANIDHSPAAGSRDKLASLTDSVPLQCHMKMADWASPKGLEPLYTSYTKVNPGPLKDAPWGYSTINIPRDTVFMHILKNPVGKTGMPKGETLTVGLLKTGVKSVTWMNTGMKLPFRQDGNNLEITIRGMKADPIDTIIKVELDKSLPRVATRIYPSIMKQVRKPGNLAFMKPAKLLSLDGQRELVPSTMIFYASKAVDGFPETVAQAGWEYAWTLQVDLEAVQTVSRVVVSFSQITYATEYSVSLSADGVNWETIAHITGSKGETGEFKIKPAQVRYARVSGIKPDGPDQPGLQMAVSELEIYK
ncbi:MAG: galactose-binding domain-containing protein [Armatimonadota bacterium]